MAVYLEIIEGESPEAARPVLVTRDPEILRAVADALHRRVASTDDARTRAALELVRDEAGGRSSE